jgi:hypothetical protein
MRTAFVIFMLFAAGFAAASARAGTPKFGKDKVAASLYQFLTGAFADVQADIKSNSMSACASVEKANTVFSPAMLEYSTHTGDYSFYKQVRAWYEKYCGREPDTPAPDED